MHLKAPLHTSLASKLTMVLLCFYSQVSSVASHNYTELLCFMCNAKIEPRPTETSIREACITLNNFWLLIINQSHLIFTAGLMGNSISTLCQVATALQCEVMSQRRCSCASWGGHWSRACKKGGQKLPPELFSFAKTLNSLYTFI